MKIIVAANIVPFLHGGAEYHMRGLVASLRAAGHSVELLRLPFRFQPEAEVRRLMEFAEGTDLNSPNGVGVDKVISLQFPAYGVQHADHRVWMMHQHRSVYELYSEQPPSEALTGLAEQVRAFDQRTLSRASALFANSERVAERLKIYNGLDAEPLYHPPHDAGLFFCEEPYEYVFMPSRLESLKRQPLLIEAAKHLRSDTRILIGGEGGQRPACEQAIARHGVAERVRLLGRLSEEEKRVLYARSIGVVFVPRDEDYGYVTLEAMLSAKPVITCSDSGGPLEFVRDGESGLVVAPEPEPLAAAIDELAGNRNRARDMGEQGRALYHAAGIGWPNVVQRLLE